MDFPNFQTLFQIARNEALLRNNSLTRSAIERSGSDLNILTAAAVAAADEVVGQQVLNTAGMFLDSATGAALDKLLYDRYGLTRKVAAASVGSVAFSTVAAAPTGFVIPAGTQVSTPDGIQFETIESEVYSAGSTGPVYVAVRSLLSGADQQARIGTITVLNSRIDGAPTDLSITNPIATAGAADTESDTEFRARGRSFFTTVQRGTLSAITQAALDVPGVVRANTFELLDTNGAANYRVACVIADQYTDTLANYTTPNPTYQEQSQVLAQDVFNYLQDYRPAGVFVQVQLAQVILQQISLSLSFKPGVNLDTVALQARAAITNYINNLAPGESLYLEPMILALRTVSGLVVDGNEISVQNSTAVTATDPLVYVKPLQVLRTGLELVRATSVNPGTPIGTYLNPDAYTLAG